MAIPSYERILNVLRRANQIAASTRLDELLRRTLDLFVEVAGAEAGTLYLYDAERNELIFKVVKGDANSQRLIGTRFSAQSGIAGAALAANRPLFVANVAQDTRWDTHIGELSSLKLHTVYCLPLTLQNRPIGVIQVFNLPQSTVNDEEDLELLHVLSNSIVSEIEKTRLLDAAQRREQRLHAMVDIVSRLTTTLDREELLTLIMNYARDLLEVEATSIWELDVERNLLVLHVATGERGDQLKETTMPVGQGFIGRCVATGQPELVDDVRHDPRHYKQIDQSSGFETRSLLSVPLRAPSIQLGGERGELKASIIGGAQAVNKRGGGAFTKDDIELLETFASQAATVLQLSRLYEETHKLFMGIMKAVTNCIDAKDPYTQGHSQRVSEFSVAIAEEIGLPREEVYDIKIGALLHDVGKIAVPDAILKKQDRLSDDEYDEMKKHPVKGYEMMSEGDLDRLMRARLPALLEHHERLDGRGYPHRLTENQISRIARIVAVADVFDALTSDRQYRPAKPIAEAFEILERGAGHEFDSECVAALIRARAKGNIVTQRERSGA